MNFGISFFLNSILLGVGLAMDAFSVSLANGLNEPKMRGSKMCTVAGTFAFFQALMPLIGWVCVHTIVKYFTFCEKLVPWIALILLCFIGGKMLYENIKNKGQSDEEVTSLGFTAILMQGIATSIDALSVGFTISNYNLTMALVCALIIALVTFVICLAGLFIGKKFGTKFSSSAQIFGGVILILIGIEIFVSSFVK